MSQQDKLEVIDKEGWRRTYPLQKSIIHIGSDARNDIILESGRGSGVSARHLQLIAANHGAGYQLVNLGETEIILTGPGEQLLPPHAVTQLGNGDTINLGEFTLIFHSSGSSLGPGPMSAAAPGKSQNIGLTILLPQLRLAPYQSIEGLVRLQNLGQQTAQFELELLGLDHDCYDIEPGPLLSSGAEREVLFRLHHRGGKPLAGQVELTIVAAAPKAYWGEQAKSSQIIEILPAYRHKLKILRPGQPDTQAVNDEQLLTPKAGGELRARPQQDAGATIPQAAAPDAAQLWGQPAEPVPAQPPTTLKLQAKTPPVAPPPTTANEEASEIWGTTSGETTPLPPPPPPAPPPSAEDADLWGAPSEQPAVEPPTPKISPPAAEELPEDWWQTPAPPAAPPRPEPEDSWPGIAPEADVQPRARDRVSSDTFAALPAPPPTTEPAAIEAGIPPREGRTETPAVAWSPQPQTFPAEAQPEPPPVADESAAKEADSTVKKWWTRLRQRFLAVRAEPAQKSSATPTTAAQISEAVTEVTTTQAGAPAAAETAPPEAELPAEIAPREPIETEAKAVEAETPAEGAETTPPAAVTEASTEAAAEPLPGDEIKEAEAAAQPDIEAEAISQPESRADLPPIQPETQPAEELAAAVETEVEAEGDEAPETLAVEEEPFKLKSWPETPPPAQHEVPAELEDLWAADAEPEALPELEQKQVIKLKASSAPPLEPHPAESEPEVPPEVEDWWSTEAETVTEEQPSQKD